MLMTWLSLSGQYKMNANTRRTTPHQRALARIGEASGLHTNLTKSYVVPIQCEEEHKCGWTRLYSTPPHLSLAPVWVCPSPARNSGNVILCHELRRSPKKSARLKVISHEHGWLSYPTIICSHGHIPICICWLLSTRQSGFLEQLIKLEKGSYGEEERRSMEVVA